MTKIEFEPCGHKLSLVTGIYVIMQGDKLAATCNSLKLVHEWLDGVKYEEAHEVKIYLSDFEGDFTNDDVTLLIVDDLWASEPTSYARWVEYFGYELPFLDFWFDTWGPTVHGGSIAARLKRYNEINAPVRG